MPDFTVDRACVLWVFEGLLFCCIMSDGVIAGGMAGVVVETVLYPIDTIKTRLQVSLLYR